jgi:hypothetical protein
MTIELTPMDISGLWADLVEEFRLRLIDKRDAEEMRFLGDVLEQLGVMDQQSFLEDYATTIGRSVYLPFELGDPNSRALLYQAMTICHEAQHGHQHSTKGRSRWAIKYVADPAYRAAQEAEAMTTSCEVYYLLTGGVLTPERQAEKLTNYALGADDIATVTKRLTSAFRTVDAGGISTAAGKVARDFFATLA